MKAILLIKHIYLDPSDRTLLVEKDERIDADTMSRNPPPTFHKDVNTHLSLGHTQLFNQI